jgi:uncharacterized protein with HEPN domain
MRSAADAIARYVSGVTQEEFGQDQMRQDAVIRRLEIMGEAAHRLMLADAEHERNFPALPLRDIKDMRNLVAHGYDAVDLDIVWDTVTSDVPALGRQLDGVMPVEEGMAEIGTCQRL